MSTLARNMMINKIIYIEYNNLKIKYLSSDQHRWCNGKLALHKCGSNTDQVNPTLKWVFVVSLLITHQKGERAKTESGHYVRAERYVYP